MDYIRYQVEDFILDPYFQKWVKNPDSQTEDFWNSWIKQHPEKYAILEKAKNFLSSLHFETSFRDEQTLQKIKQRIEDHIDHLSVQETVNENDKTITPWWGQPVWHKVAAVFVIGILLSLLYLLQYDQWNRVQYVTQYGEIKEVMLPDSSIVNLNGNSSLTYQNDWEKSSFREVWLEGEAFFEVQKAKPPAEVNHLDSSGHHTFAAQLAHHPAKFIVHTAHLDIEVLGTAFNVNHRHDQTKVFLESGKVKVRTSKSQEVEEVFMEPGEVVEYARAEASLVKKATDAGKYASWRNHQLIFDKVPLKEIAQMLKDTYGLEVIFENKELMKRRYKGALPSDNVDMLITALSRLYPVSREGKRIIFHSVEQK